jgi:hypothetical protein
LFIFFRRGVTVFPSFFYKLEQRIISFGSKDEKKWVSLIPDSSLEQRW